MKNPPKIEKGSIVQNVVNNPQGQLTTYYPAEFYIYCSGNRQGWKIRMSLVSAVYVGQGDIKSVLSPQINDYT